MLIPKKWRVSHWIAHTIPGFPSPSLRCVRTYRFHWVASLFAGYRRETQDGRGLYYATIERILTGLGK